MRLFILGSTGKIGERLVAQAQSRSHSVTTFGRSSSNSVTGNPMNADELAAALPNHDAILSVLGSRGIGRSSVRTDSARATVDGMQRARVRRLIIVSSALQDQHIGWLTRFLSRTLLRHITGDQRAMEDIVTKSGLDWTLLRPPMLHGGPLTLRYVVSQIAPADASGMNMSRDDVAHMMLDLAESGSHVKEIVWLRGER
jgi:putative NADH-flavin reductase